MPEGQRGRVTVKASDVWVEKWKVEDLMSHGMNSLKGETSILVKSSRVIDRGYEIR